MVESRLDVLRRMRDFVVGLEGELSQLYHFQRSLGMASGLGSEQEWSRANSIANQREARAILLSVAGFVREKGEEFGLADDAHFFEDAIAESPEEHTTKEVMATIGESLVHGDSLLRKSKTLLMNEI